MLINERYEECLNTSCFVWNIENNEIKSAYLLQLSCKTSRRFVIHSSRFALSSAVCEENYTTITSQIDKRKLQVWFERNRAISGIMSLKRWQSTRFRERGRERERNKNKINPNILWLRVPFRRVCVFLCVTWITEQILWLSVMGFFFPDQFISNRNEFIIKTKENKCLATIMQKKFTKNVTVREIYAVFKTAVWIHVC